MGNIWKDECLRQCQEGPLKLSMGKGKRLGPACNGISLAQCEDTTAHLRERPNLVGSLVQVKIHPRNSEKAVTARLEMVDSPGRSEKLG